MIDEDRDDPSLRNAVDCVRFYEAETMVCFEL